jgi:ribosomal protein S25
MKDKKRDMSVICPNCNYHIPRDTPEERFWSRVDKNGPQPENPECDGVCWIWCGYRDDRGYGRSMNNSGGGSHQAHRKAWEYYYQQEIPNGLLLRHMCDNPPCVNPKHLIVGTQADNTRDMIERGRMRILVGEEQGMTKLNEEQVREIRKEYSEGKVSYQALADKYGVGNSTIKGICKRLTWKHIEDDYQPAIDKITERLLVASRNGKLSEEQVRAIREDCIADDFISHNEVGKKHGVSHNVVYGIHHRLNYKHVK